MEGGRCRRANCLPRLPPISRSVCRLSLANKLTDNGSRQCTYLPLDICCPLCSKGAEEPGQHDNDYDDDGDDDDDHNVIDDDVDGDFLPQAEEHC